MSSNSESNNNNQVPSLDQLVYVKWRANGTNLFPAIFIKQLDDGTSTQIKPTKCSLKILSSYQKGEAGQEKNDFLVTAAVSSSESTPIQKEAKRQNKKSPSFCCLHHCC